MILLNARILITIYRRTSLLCYIVTSKKFFQLLKALQSPTGRLLTRIEVERETGEGRYKSEGETERDRVQA